MTVTRKHYPTGTSGAVFTSIVLPLTHRSLPPGHIIPRSRPHRPLHSAHSSSCPTTPAGKRQACGSCPQCLTFWDDHMGLVHERQSRHECNPRGSSHFMKSGMSRSSSTTGGVDRCVLESSWALWESCSSACCGTGRAIAVVPDPDDGRAC